ncbi:hypothetical protein Tco_0744277 [Tanacetum coccineum]
MGIVFQAHQAFAVLYKKIKIRQAMDETIHPPGSYSMEDAELINENCIPINAYSEAFLCHMGISRNYFQSPEEVPTFNVRRRPGRIMELGLEPTEDESTNVLAPTPLAVYRRVTEVMRDSAAKDTVGRLPQGRAESCESYLRSFLEEKMALLVKVEQERANSAHYKASCHWAVKYLEGGKNNHFAGLDEFRQRVEELLEKQEEKLLKLIALARGKAEAVEELHEKKLLTVPAAQVLGYNDNAYEELVAVMETMKLLELPHIHSRS